MSAGKPRWGPIIFKQDVPVEPSVGVPASVTRALDGAWHALGTHLPQAITRNKAARRQVLRLR